MSYVFDSITSRDNPSAALQAENTNNTIGLMWVKVCKIIKVAIMDSDNIMPSKHHKDDIK